eukprot:NODE_2509_length_922_cov_222.486736.p2 GENE.NODE_2509_length_922_cov_222.486736~~NODE_2509_length_922_cov_222.486736.p2  ORF type:complete len:222 (-),score=65.72 NODE_2509_length_922_cov_222.486736:239-904(-)
MGQWIDEQHHHGSSAMDVAERNSSTMEGGCCYAIGYGDEMRPCCLHTRRAADATACARKELRGGTALGLAGGAAGFRNSNCPATAEQAAQWLEEARASVAAAAPAAGTDSAVGCCYSIGYGERMAPCCLETAARVSRAACAVGGHTTGFSSGDCPATAAEASRWLDAGSSSALSAGSVQGIGAVALLALAATAAAMAALALRRPRRAAHNDEEAGFARMMD